MQHRVVQSNGCIPPRLYIIRTSLISFKVKLQHRTDHEGPEGEQRYSSTLSLASALDGGGWSTPWSLYPCKDTRYPLNRRLGGPQGRSGWVWNVSPLHRVSIPGPSSPQRVAVPTELSRPTNIFRVSSKFNARDTWLPERSGDVEVTRLFCVG